MIKLNGKDYEWSEGLTVEELLKQKRYTYPRIIVKVNDQLISREKYSSTLIRDNDDVKAIHLLAGG